MNFALRKAVLNTEPGAVAIALSGRYWLSLATLEKTVDRHHGFAARCEAVAVPRRLAAGTLGLCPWFGLGPSCGTVILPLPT